MRFGTYWGRAVAGAFTRQSMAHAVLWRRIPDQTPLLRQSPLRKAVTTLLLRQQRQSDPPAQRQEPCQLAIQGSPGPGLFRLLVLACPAKSGSRIRGQHDAVLAYDGLEPIDSGVGIHEKISFRQ
jgi:hypothetical protein